MLPATRMTRRHRRIRKDRGTERPRRVFLQSRLKKTMACAVGLPYELTSRLFIILIEVPEHECCPWLGWLRVGDMLVARAALAQLGGRSRFGSTQYDVRTLDGRSSLVTHPEGLVLAAQQPDSVDQYGAECSAWGVMNHAELIHTLTADCLATERSISGHRFTGGLSGYN